MEIKIGEEEITLSGTDKICLLNDLLEIEDWILKAIAGKISKCKKRFMKKWYPILMADPEVETIPANEEDFINLVTSRPDYKSRAEREEEEI